MPEHSQLTSLQLAKFRRVGSPAILAIHAMKGTRCKEVAELFSLLEVMGTLKSVVFSGQY